MIELKGRDFQDETHGEEGPVFESSSGVVPWPLGQQIGSSAGGRNDVDENVTTLGGRESHVDLDMLQELDICAVFYFDRVPVDIVSWHYFVQTICHESALLLLGHILPLLGQSHLEQEQGR